MIHGFSKTRLYQIHLVNETEDLGSGTAFVEGADYVRVRDNVGLELARLNVEDEDQYGDGAKDMTSRLCKVVFHEAILTRHSQYAASIPS